MLDCFFYCLIYQIISVSDKFLRNYLLCYCQLTSVPLLPDGQLVHDMCKIGRKFLSNISIIFHYVIIDCQNFWPGRLWGYLVCWHHLLRTLPGNEIFRCFLYHRVVDCFVSCFVCHIYHLILDSGNFLPNNFQLLSTNQYSALPGDFFYMNHQSNLPSS